MSEFPTISCWGGKKTQPPIKSRYQKYQFSTFYLVKNLRSCYLFLLLTSSSWIQLAAAKILLYITQIRITYTPDK